MGSFAYHLAWAILATQATLVLFLVVYIVGRVVEFAQFLWQEYVRSKIKRGWRSLMVVVIKRLVEMHNIAHDELYKKDKSLIHEDLTLHEDAYFQRLHKGPNLNGVLRQ
jgi:hypothetical protein